MRILLALISFYPSAKNFHENDNNRIVGRDIASLLIMKFLH